MKRALPYLRVGLYGFVLSLCFPPFSFPAILAVIALTLFFREFRIGRHPSILTFVFGLGYFVSLLRWMSVVGIDAWIGLAVLCSVWWFAISMVMSRLPVDKYWSIRIGILFTSAELLRDRFPFGGFGWGQIGVLAADAPLLKYVVPVVGQTGLTFLIFFISAQLASSGVKKTVFAKQSLVALAVLIAAVPLSVLDIERDTDQQASIALVQGGVVHTGLGTFGPPRAVLKKHAELTLQNLSRLMNVDLVVWPESSSDYDPLKDPESKTIITNVVKTLDKPLLLGANLELDDGRVSNSSLLWSKFGVNEVYQKQRLVPFGEFLPFRDVIVRYTDRALLMPRDFAAGSSPGSITVKNVVIDIAICFEVADDSIILNNAADAGAIVVHTNNATYQHLGQSEQQLLSAKMRALETQRTVLSVSTSGVSAVVAPNGDVEQLLTQDETGVLITKIISTSGSTFAMQLHNITVFAIFALGLMVVVEVLYKRRRVTS